MVLFSLEKRKGAALPPPPCPTRNDEPVLLTWPVGPWFPLAVPLAVVGMATKPLGGLISVLITFVLSVTALRVDVLLAFLETQKGPLREIANPKGPSYPRRPLL